MILKIVVVSDTHGNTDLLAAVIEDCTPFDIIIHCGDGLRDICSADIPEKSFVLKVTGNTDLNSNSGIEDILTEKILNKTVMVTHGHQFDVKTGLKQLLHEAKYYKAGVVLFGHTHEQFIRKGTPLLFNPGNLSGGNYGIIHASEDKEWMFEHRKIKKG